MLPLQVGLAETITLIGNYGFAVVMAILFWRYIKSDAQKVETALRDLTDAVNRMNRTLDRIEDEAITNERRRRNQRFRRGPDPKQADGGDGE